MGKWEEVKVGDICEKVTDGTHSTPKYTEKGIPFLSVKDVTGGIISLNNTRFISKEEHEKLIKRCNPEFGDLLYTKVGTTGVAKVIDVENEFSIFVSLALLKPKKELINSHFFEYILNSPNAYDQAQSRTRGVANRNLVLRDIKEIYFFLPSLKEQKAIVAKLDALFERIDKAIALLEENIKHTEALMGSVLDEEFGRLESKKIKLSEIAEVVGGGTPKTAIKEYWSDDIIWLSPIDLPPIGEISWVKDSRKKISKLGLLKSSAKLLPKGAVIYSSRASIGKIAVAECELATNQGFTSFIVSEKLLNSYLAYALKYFTPQIEGLSNSTTFKEVSKTSFKSFEIPVPSISLQKEIVKKLEIATLKTKKINELFFFQLANLKSLKSSLLDKAFKG